MILAVSGGFESILELFTIFIIFILVLVITWFATKWIANTQQMKGKSSNIEILETFRLAPNKYIQIVRVGDKFFSMAVCKESIEFLGEISGEQLLSPDKQENNVPDFYKLLDKVLKSDKNRKNEE